MDLSPLWISLKVSATATVVAFITGILAAWLVVYIDKGKIFIDGLFTLPMVLPPTVLGFILLLILGKNGAIGQFLDRLGIHVVFSWVGASIAAAVVAFPMMYRSVRAAFEQLDPDLIHVARTLGKKEGWIMWNIMLPNAWPGVLSGTILAFARSMGEFGATSLLAGNIPGKTRTMSQAVWSAVQMNNREEAKRWSLMLIIISFVVIYLTNHVLKRESSSQRSTWLARIRRKKSAADFARNEEIEKQEHS
ncbi:MAG TPA: molybdate ABC transporter permease subunit [Clostridiaceae bacterium]|nr:molybdate ABC transporter permease subunit [Clostridiaceae bacterium]